MSGSAVKIVTGATAPQHPKPARTEIRDPLSLFCHTPARDRNVTAPAKPPVRRPTGRKRAGRKTGHGADPKRRPTAHSGGLATTRPERIRPGRYRRRSAPRQALGHPGHVAGGIGDPRLAKRRFRTPNNEGRERNAGETPLTRRHRAHLAPTHLHPARRRCHPPVSTIPAIRRPTATSAPAELARSAALRDGCAPAAPFGTGRPPISALRNAWRPTNGNGSRAASWPPARGWHRLKSTTTTTRMLPRHRPPCQPPERLLDSRTPAGSCPPQSSWLRFSDSIITRRMLFVWSARRCRWTSSR